MYIDLSVPIDEDTPVYPGDPPITIESAGMLGKDGFNDHVLTMGTHVGTHIDAPFHMLKDGKTLNDFRPGDLIGRGVLYDARKGFDLGELDALEIQAGDIVLIHTGMSEHYHEKSYFEEFKQLPEDFTSLLAGKSIKMVGLDMCSPDHEPYDMHKILLSNDILIIENLTNLGKLVGKKFRVIALPLNLRLDGAPARVIAEVEV